MDTVLISMQENLCAFGIRYVHHEARKAGHRSELLFPNLQSALADDSAYAGFVDALARALRKDGKDVVGISFMSYQSDLVRRLCLDLKKAAPRTVLVGGGIHVTAFPEQSLDYFDAVCLGEGELSFAEFLKEFRSGRSLRDIQVPGIMTAAAPARRPKVSPLPRSLDTLAILPVVDESAFLYRSGRFYPIEGKHLAKFQRYNGNVYDIMTSRGCPLECAYCANSVNVTLYGSEWKKLRYRSVDHVMTELTRAIAERPTIRFINFQDDSFTSRALSWFEEFVPRYRQEVGLPLMFRMIPGSVDDAKMRLLSQLPVLAAGVGLQSGSRRILDDVYKRPVGVPAFTRTVEKLQAARIMPVVDVILNNPYEDERDIAETIAVLASMRKPFVLELYGFRFYPGTEIAARALAEGIIAECDTCKTQATIDADEKKDILNTLIFITAQYPRRFIYFLMRRKKSPGLRVMMPLLVLAGSIANAWHYILMVMRSHGYNPLRCIRFLYLTIDPAVTVLHVFPFLRHLIARADQAARHGEKACQA